MKQFLLVLLFHKLISLTPGAVDVIGELQIRPSKPISAITTQARFRVDVSAAVGAGPLERRAVQTQEAFPNGSVEIEVRQRDGATTVFQWSGSILFDESSTEMLLYAAEESLPLNVPFDTVVVRSRRPMPKVVIKWENSRW